MLLSTRSPHTQAHTQERAWRKFLMAIQRLAQEATYYVAPPMAERRPKETEHLFSTASSEVLH